MPVLGTRNDNPDIVRKDEVDEAIIAMPTVPDKGALSLWERANDLWQQANIRGLQVALGTGLSVVFLWLAFRDVPLSQVVTTFSRADYRFVALALALVLASPLTRAARWRLLYHPDQKGLSCFRLAEVLLISQMLNIVVPARLGEVARIYFMGKTESQSRARTLGTIAVEKWLDILMLLLLVLLVPIFVSLPPWFRDSRLSLAVFATAFLGVALTLSLRQRSAAHPGGIGFGLPARRLASEDSSVNGPGSGQLGCAALSLGGT
ncbi:MAG: lysylphosphatidylglycerol synthase transmembrane domain-containing protein [Anaerolineae bacterium]